MWRRDNMTTFYIKLPPDFDLSAWKQVCITEKGNKITIDPHCKHSDVTPTLVSETTIDKETRRREEKAAKVRCEDEKEARRRARGV